MPVQKQLPALDADSLRNRLKLRSLASETELLKRHRQAGEFFEKLGLRPGRIREHAGRLLTSGALAGTLLLSPHSAAAASGQVHIPTSEEVSSEVSRLQLSSLLKQILNPVTYWKLTPDQEDQISREIESTYGVKAQAQLEGNRLNNSYGRMGAEQHLPRYPGDSISQHESLQDSGITPGLGGWGYFAYSKDQMTQELYDDEKWYVAVQTLYLPNWNTDTKRLAAWYKFRRVVVVNPENGKAVVADVADAGPSWWTGKHFGGSPEVMAYLGINFGMQNHPVVLFFLDDPNREVPLGPLEYNIARNKKSLANKS